MLLGGIAIMGIGIWKLASTKNTAWWWLIGLGAFLIVLLTSMAVY